MSPVATLPQTSLEDALWDQIVNTVGVSAILGAGNAARLYVGGVPDGTAFPYALIRVETPRTRDEIPGQFTSNLFIEVMAFGRPRSDSTKVTQLNTLGDLIQDAFRDIVLRPLTGLIRIQSVGRQALPPGTDDVDATVIQERHTAEGFVYHLPPV